MLFKSMDNLSLAAGGTATYSIGGSSIYHSQRNQYFATKKHRGSGGDGTKPNNSTASRRDEAPGDELRHSRASMRELFSSSVLDSNKSQG